jgi:hypothetical protein
MHNHLKNVSKVFLIAALAACSSVHTKEHETVQTPPGVTAPISVGASDLSQTSRQRHKIYFHRSDAFFSAFFHHRHHQEQNRALASNSKTFETHDLIDPKYGKFEISVEKTEDSSSEPFRLTVSSLCNDNREKQQMLHPKKESLVGVTVCDFIGHDYDAESKKLTLNYMRSADGDKAGHCSAEWTQSFDLKQICAAWDE